MSNIPAGWYPDPAAAGVTPPPLRYWDGGQWTEHRSTPVAQQLPVRPDPTTPDGVPLAGWWHRVGATLIDQVFTSIVSLVVAIPAEVSLQRRMTDLQDQMQRRIDADDPHVLSWAFHRYADIYRHELPWLLLALLVVFVGQTVFVHRLGGTPGQLLTRLRVRRRDRAGNLSWSAAAGRVALFQALPGLLGFVALTSGSLVALPLVGIVVLCWQLLDPLWAAWDAQRQTLHDKIVATNVVRVR